MLHASETQEIIGKLAKSANSFFLGARKSRGRFYVVTFITTMGAVQCYNRCDRAFTSEIILFYGRISIRSIEENSGNATRKT